MPISNKQLLDLFRQGPNISIYPSGNSFAISGSPVGIISGTNASTGVNVFCGTTTINNANDTLSFFTLSGSSNVSITTNDIGEIVIDRGQVIVNTLSNQDTGARIFSGIVGNSLVQRTIISAATNSGFTAAIGIGMLSPSSSTDSDATAFITAASITDSRQITAIQNLVRDLKAANIWNKMAAIYPVVGGTQARHSYNLKDPRDLNDAYRLVFSGGGWTHNANGMTPNGTTSWANTFLAPSAVLSVSNGHMSFYSRVQSLLASNIDMGASTGSGAANLCSLAIGRNTNTSNFTWGTQAANTVANFSSSSSQGFFVGNQNGATAADRNMFRNSISGTAATDYGTPIMPTTTIAIGALNDQNLGIANYSSRQCSFASIGSGLTASEISAFTTAVETYQATLGRQIVTLQNVVTIGPTNTTADRFYTTTTGPVLNTSSLIIPTAVTGNMAISATPVTTSRLLIQSGTGAISQIRLTPFATEPTNPPNGSIWYSTSGNTLKFEKDNNPSDFIFQDNNISLSGASGSTNQILLVNTAGTITPIYTNSLGLFDSTPTVVSFYSLEENIEKSIIPSTIVGSTTLLASTNPYNPELVVGRKYRYTAKGTIYADTSSFFSPTYLNINIKLGSTTIITNQILYGIYIDGPNIYSGEFEIDVTFTIRNSGLVVGSGKVLFLTSPPSNIGGDPVIFGLYSQDATIDTTINQVFDCTCYLTGGGFDMYIDTFDITVNESFLEILN